MIKRKNRLYCTHRVFSHYYYSRTVTALPACLLDNTNGNITISERKFFPPSTRVFPKKESRYRTRIVKRLITPCDVVSASVRVRLGPRPTTISSRPPGRRIRSNRHETHAQRNPETARDTELRDSFPAIYTVRSSSNVVVVVLAQNGAVWQERRFTVTVRSLSRRRRSSTSRVPQCRADRRPDAKNLCVPVRVITVIRGRRRANACSKRLFSSFCFGGRQTKTVNTR